MKSTMAAKIQDITLRVMGQSHTCILNMHGGLKDPKGQQGGMHAA